MFSIMILLLLYIYDFFFLCPLLRFINSALDSRNMHLLLLLYMKFDGGGDVSCYMELCCDNH